MKKLLALGACALAFTATPALAGHHEGCKKGGMFEKHDTDGDGFVSKDEFLKHSEDKFSRIDENGDGKISKEEGMAAHEKMRKKMKEHKEKRKEMMENKAETE